MPASFAIGSTPFRFERSFDRAPDRRGAKPAGKPSEPPEVANVEAHPPRPLFSAADLDAARQDGVAAGRAAALAEVADTHETRLAAALEAFVASAKAEAGVRTELDARASRDAVLLASAMVRKLFPKLARNHGVEEIVGVLETVLDGFSDSPVLTLRVGAAVREEVSQRIQPFMDSNSGSGSFVVIGDASIGDGDCRIEWSGGGAIRDSEALQREMDGLLESVGGVLRETAEAEATTPRNTLTAREATPPSDAAPGTKP